MSSDIDKTILVRWFGNNSRLFDGRTAKVSWDSIVSVNGVQKKATVERLAVGDVLELNFLNDPTLWKAVVTIENCDSEVREGRLIRTPNLWQREAHAIRESDTRRTSGHATLLPSRYQGRNSSSEAPLGDSEEKGGKQKRSHSEKELSAPKPKKQRGTCVASYESDRTFIFIVYASESCAKNRD